MVEKPEIRGFAFLCDYNGIIKEKLRDDFGLANNNPRGKLFTNLLNPENRESSLNFLMDIKTQKITFDYRFNLFVNDKNYNFYFMGLLLGENLLIIGANNHKEAIDFTDHLQEINNEQSNLIRELIKGSTKKELNEKEDSEQLFDEITLLNNELVNLQRELTQKNRELERLNTLKNKFIGMAAHDLRNPLGVIINFTEFLKDEAVEQLSDEHLKFINHIYSSAEFMLKLVEDLLDVSLIESGKLNLSFKRFNLSALIIVVVETMNTLASHKDIEIKFKADPKTILIEADKNKLEQVLQNLLGNAIKFSFPGGTINVDLAMDENNILFSVEDKGKGIPDAQKDDVFAPFKKLSDFGTSGEKGSGLGLAIVKRIVEGHKGKIWFESEAGKGTTFYVKLPRSNQSYI